MVPYPDQVFLPRLSIVGANRLTLQRLVTCVPRNLKLPTEDLRLFTLDSEL